MLRYPGILPSSFGTLPAPGALFPGYASLGKWLRNPAKLAVSNRYRSNTDRLPVWAHSQGAELIGGHPRPKDGPHLPTPREHFAVSVVNLTVPWLADLKARTRRSRSRVD